ncbi:aminomethyl-transferring glycine dehydrogenase subunit GcvPB [Rugamonas aquatica]|uniref:glycine dehydrogenase (aminomethyl-transferring) n=1 Tax=Rugamonas aquatica TaxID=2743357 RepID=A0A6A7NAS7_9BURK|nr:aminomethyl-transferring glycine dehydrogenase subunit GcvPB [Rugamonas aquatica]MQA42249.1 aminotransferase class V-fold PLP-dependent enzyme [Rugamonas aquatica]
MTAMENIATHRKQQMRRYHQARWDEPVIFELSQPGERGILVPEVEPDIVRAAGQPLAGLPAAMLRQRPPALPEMSQNRVLRHYLRLSQETLGADLNVDVGQGTCTMKYNPKINDQLARQPGMSELHPRQPDSTVQGMLEVIAKLEGVLCEVSGMDAVSLQPRGGSQAIFANMAMVRAWHESRGDAAQRDEVITTIFSHPSDAACAKLAGYKVITLYPDANGYPDLAALKAAVSPRTAALVITNPEDTGIFNSRIREFVDVVHAAGGLCVYDQANANGLLGIARAREAGFDLCHFNLHKTFATPHACGGPAVGAVCCTAALAPFLPGPLVRHTDGRYHLVDGAAQSIGKISSFTGTASIMLRAYAWIMNLGADGLRTVSEIAVLNNNYMMHELLKIDGMAAPYAPGKRRIEQVRYSWQGLTEATGVTSEEIGLRAADFGVHYWTSHHPYVVPEPATIEPTESYSRADLDEFIGVMRHIAGEAHSDPDLVKTAPHNCPVHRVQGEMLDDPERWSITWRAYQRKLGERGLA